MKLWKFMDLTKFLNLILTEQLHFQRINTFKDVYEGYDDHFYNNEDLRHLLGNQFEELKKLSEAIKYNTYISCWHLNEYESAAMWDLYANKSGSIAIETDINTLKKSLLIEGRQILNYENVIYLDYQEHKKTKHAQEINEIFKCQVYKRKSFEHEKEFRIILRPFRDHRDMLNLVTISKNQSLEEIRKTATSMRVNLNINTLVQKIYLSPETPEWEKMTIENLLKRLNLNIKVIKSDLYQLK